MPLPGALTESCSMVWYMTDETNRVASALAADHVGALYPDVDTPFSDGADVVQRLFPYHVFQLPEEDRHFKGKRRADPDDLAQEVKGKTVFNLDKNGLLIHTHI